MIGTYQVSGSDNNGYIFTIHNNTVSHLYDFPSLANPGKYPIYGMTKFDSDTFYGIIKNGLGEQAAIYKYTLSTNTFEVVYHFDANTLHSPVSSLVVANNKLYGFAGKNIYSFDPVQNTANIEYTAYSNFSSTFFCIENNTIYGISGQALFSYDLNSQTYSILHYFSQHTASGFSAPYYYNGNLYGVLDDTNYAQDSGILYKYDLTTQNLQILHSFSNYSPKGKITIYNGNIYGTFSSHKKIFNYNLLTNQYQEIFDFSDQTYGGNANDAGVNRKGLKLIIWTSQAIFTYNLLFHSTEILTTNLYNSYGYNNDLVITDNNQILAPVFGGGTYRYGYIYAYDFSTHSGEIKINLNETPKGANPVGQLSQINGKIYGITNHGGAHGYGNIYELSGGILTDLYDFTHYNYLRKLLIDNNKIIFLKGNTLIGIDIDTHQVSTLQTYPNNYGNARLTKASDGFYYALTNYNIYIKINPTDYSLEEFPASGIYLGQFSELMEYNGKLYGISEIGYMRCDPVGCIFSFDLTTHQDDIFLQYPVPRGGYRFDHSGTEIIEYQGDFYALINADNGVSNTLVGILGFCGTVKSFFGQKILNVGDGTLLFGAENQIYQLDIANQTRQSVLDFPEDNYYSPFGSLSILSPAGIDEYTNAKIRLYPNPASDFVMIENLTEYRIKQYKVLNFNGQTLLSNLVIKNGQIDIQNLAKGMYLLQITLENGQTLTQKILKN